ncbi:protein LSM14 homolog B isoform X1 [Bactrocera neohumeralis]|uniref:protein LSM14 homolog B isoform X1 n=1 Tax=Bactrocera tryoni TaxID=59916 RepID=UPI001A9875BB|nr:protein LSM14 homolog B isoform X1 [Bactrocera tryoni]XP_050337338.1 protein LSM14 homolog B isoform X1 [Bactrocera neohumeralis]
MSAGMPELGSKISLISKADIRYEGRLYTVDPQECTIALSNVRSFGTEDRETQFQIAPQSQIYDYILFRGSDIKDIRVVNNSLPHPNDPAIMQVQLQNGQHMMPHFPMPNMNPPHAPPMNAVGGYGNPFGMGGLGIGGAGGAAPSLAPGSGAPGPYILGGGNQPQSTQPPQPQQQQQSKSQQQQKQPNILAGASRSTTPMSHVSLKSGSPDLAAQQQHQNQHPNQNTGHGGNSRDAGHKRQNHQQRGGNNNQRNNDFYQQSRDRRDSGRHTDGNYNNQHEVRGGNNYSNQRNNHQRGGGGGGGGQNHAWTMHRGGPNNANNMMVRNRGGGRGRMQNQGFRPMGGPGGNQNKPRNPKNAIKFLQDFDFEQANVKFEELRSQLSKLKVGEEPKTEQINGETDKKEDSGNETGAGEHEPEEEEITVGYDKTKSFFDNISCEAAQDRSKNKKNDWRQERKLNSETFGFSSTRRGGYRGRGNYYNRNMGSYGGGYNRNYRGGSNYRNRSRNPNAAANNANGGASNTNTGNSGTSNNNNSANTAVALKSQVQTPQTSVSASGSTPNATKLATVENSNTPQPIAAGGVGQ